MFTPGDWTSPVGIISNKIFVCHPDCLNRTCGSKRRDNDQPLALDLLYSGGITEVKIHTSVLRENGSCFINQENHERRNYYRSGNKEEPVSKRSAKRTSRCVLDRLIRTVDALNVRKKWSIHPYFRILSVHEIVPTAKFPRHGRPPNNGTNSGFESSEFNSREADDWQRQQKMTCSQLEINCSVNCACRQSQLWRSWRSPDLRSQKRKRSLKSTLRKSKKALST